MFVAFGDGRACLIENILEGCGSWRKNDSRSIQCWELRYRKQHRTDHIGDKKMTAMRQSLTTLHRLAIGSLGHGWRKWILHATTNSWLANIRGDVMAIFQASQGRNVRFKLLIVVKRKY